MTGASEWTETDLADAILDGSRRRPVQPFEGYFEGTDRSDAFGTADEGVYRLPADATGIRPNGPHRFFRCQDDSVRRCPADCQKRLLLDSVPIHLNDNHRWSRERIAEWPGGQARAAPR